MKQRPDQSKSTLARHVRPELEDKREKPWGAATSSGRVRWFPSLNWFLSRTVRHATHVSKHVWHILCAQRDLLSPLAIANVTSALNGLRRACAGPLDRRAIQDQMANLELVANKWLKPYPNAALRENVEVLLVAIVVAMGIRTFFIQPFKIPTGSMQPTLYGITSTPDYWHFPQTYQGEAKADPDFEIPNRLKRFFLFWVAGLGYDHVVAERSGVVESVQKTPTRFLLFNLKQSFRVGGKNYTVWFPTENLLERSGLALAAGSQKVFEKGEDIIKLKAFSGDHLFVDRFTYNFRPPRRGEIIVFETKDIPAMSQDQQGQFYIKRLVALGGEQVGIGDDRHLYINGQRLDNFTPHFERVYSFDPMKPPADSQYSGHVNGMGPLFPSAESVQEVPPGHYMVMGDNTVNSSDSRMWGTFPKENVIGRSFFVYWPFGSQDGRPSRFGWGNR